MKLKPSEKHIKSVFENHEQQLNVDELWAGIEAKKKKRRPIFWLLGIGILAAVLLGYLLIPHNSLDNPILQEKQFVNQDQKHSESYNDETQGKLTSNTDKKTNNDQPLESQKTSFIEATQKTKESINLETQNSTSELVQSTLVSTVHNVPAYANESLFNNARIQEYTSHAFKPNTSIATALTRNQNNEKISIDNSKRNKMGSLNLLTFPLSTLDQSSTFLFPKLSCFVTTQQDAVKQSKSNWILNLEIGTGIGKGEKDLSHTEMLYQPFTIAKNRAEKLHLHWNSYFNVSTRKGNFGIGTGLKYLEILESFRFQNSVVSNYDSTGVVSIIVDEQNMVVSMEEGTITVTKISNYDFLRQNKYRYLQVPIEITRYWDSRQFGFALSLNALASFSLSRNGEVLNDLETFANLNNPLIKNQYASGPQFFIGAKTSFSYRFSDRYFINLSPYAQKAMNSSFRKSSGLIEKPFLFGINLGLGITL